MRCAGAGVCRSVPEDAIPLNRKYLNSEAVYDIDLKEFRRANNMTQKSLAEYLGVGQGFISQIEKGDRPLPDKYINKILSDETVDSSMVYGESSSAYRQADEEFHHSVQSALVAVREIAESNRILAESTRELTTTNKILATSNTELVQKLALLMEEIREKRSATRFPPIGDPKSQVASDVEGQYEKNPTKE